MNYQDIILIIGLCLFIVMMDVEGVFGFIENEKYRKLFKVFPTLILGITSIIIFPNQPFIYLGVLCGFLGDLLLIWEKKKVCFLLGGTLFFVGHVFYLLSLFSIAKVALAWWYYLILALAFVVFFILFFILLRKDMKTVERVCGSVYVYILVFLLVTSIVITIKVNEPLLCLMSIGYGLFITSDLCLGYKLFIKEYKRDDFYIMMTYLLAQALIVLGQILPLLIK